MHSQGLRRDGWPPGLEAAMALLAARRPAVGFDVRWFDTIGSTMDVAADAAAAGAPSGFVALADRQTAGRGRRGHRWISPPGAGLYFSYLARPTRRVELITIAAGVGVLDGVRTATGLAAHLKWPNDVLVGSRKLGGLLAEGAHLGTPDAAVVVGVGLNLAPAAYPADVAARATNVQDELGREVPRFELFAAVLESLADALATLEAGDADGILRRWRAASPLADGTRVRWSRGEHELHGVTAGVADDGALLVRTTSAVERVIAGELQWQLPDA